MNAFSQARTAYAAAAAPTRTPRATEYDAVAAVTRRLQSAATLGEAGFPRLVEALHDNRRMWTIFAADVAEPSNPLPAELKARILFLAEFTQDHSRKVLRNEDTAEPLIDINTAILRGLRSESA